MILSQKFRKYRKNLILLIILSIFIFQLSQIKYVSAWNTGVSSLSKKTLGNGFGYVQSQISIKGKNNSTHSLTMTFRITSNGDTDPVALSNVNVTILRNGTITSEINSVASGLSFIKTISYPIYYANNITIKGTVQAEFIVAGTLTNVVFPVQVSYISPNPPRFTIGTPINSIVMIFFLIAGIGIVIKIIGPKLAIH